MRQPAIYLPHGAGPCFFMDWTMGPKDTWDRTAAYLRSIPGSLPEAPRAALVISAHWEAEAPAILSGEKPALEFDYYGFPKHTYELTWPAPGAPSVAARVHELLKTSGIDAQLDPGRAWDHGVFIPMKVAFPDANVPTAQLSLKRGLDPAEHLAIGRALEPLRDEGVLVVGSGLSYHNMRGFNSPASAVASRAFDDWLDRVAKSAPAERDAALIAWERAPHARAVHPREEHLMPLMVVAGAAGADTGRVVFRDQAMNVTVSATQFG